MTNSAAVRGSKDSGVTWIGYVPDDWDVVPAKTIFVERKAASRPTDVHLTPSQQHGVLPQAEYMERTGNRVVLNLTGADAMRHVERGDFISHLRSFQGGLEYSGLGGKVSAAYTVLRPRRDLDSGFFRYLVKSSRFIQALQTTTEQLRDGQSIRYAQIATLPFPFPPLVEQRAIRDFLDRETGEIDAFVRDQTELIGLLQERRAATISHAVTKGLSPNEPLKPSGSTWLGRVPVGWTIQKLGWLAAVRNGSTPSRNESKYWLEGTVPWVSSTVANLSEVVASTEFVSPLAVQECHLPTIPPGSLLVGLTGQGKTRGMVTRLRFASTINQHLAAVTLRRGLTPEYAYWVLTAAYDHLRFVSDGNGGTKGGLTCEELAALQVPVPALETQRSIASSLEQAVADIDLAIADGRTSILLSYERRSALISAAVTGQTDVRKHVGV